MNPERLRNYYLETQVQNSSPGQRLVLLYDGLIKNAETADALIAAPASPADSAQAGHVVSRCINILTELSASLRFEFNPLLCGTLRDLYAFFTHEFSLAFETREAKRIRAILPLIRNLRDAWATAESRRTGEIHVAAV